MKAKEILMLIKYDLDARVAKPERHIEKYGVQIAKEQRENCINEIMEESTEDLLIYEQTEAIRKLVRNAPEPEL